MEHDTQVAEPLMDMFSNLPEMLAVDLEQSSDIFQSRQLTAGAPAPWLADDGARRLYSSGNDSSHTNTVLPDEPRDTLSNGKPQQSIHQKYSDIFAPLDFNAPKRESFSSSDSSAKSEPPPLSTREESVLTVDTLLEPEKNPSPTFLHLSPTSDYATQMSWIDLDIEDASPITQRRRSSMSDFPKYMHQLRGSMETNAKTIQPRRSIDANETSTHPISGDPLSYPAQIPRRRSSLQYHETQTVTPQFTKHLGPRNSGRDVSRLPSHRPIFNESPFAQAKKMSNISRKVENKHGYRDPAHILLDSPPVSPTFKEDLADESSVMENDRDRMIASAAVSFNEWLDSDMAHLASEDHFFPRPLPHHVQDKLKFFVTNFPEPVLLCDNYLVENIRSLSQEVVRYTTNDANPEYLPNFRQQPKPTRWKPWLHSSAGTSEQQGRPNASPDVNRREWDLMKKIFPRGSDGLCEALYAYVLVYNYITSLCLSSQSHPVDPVISSRPTTPWTATRPDTGMSGGSSELDMYMSTPPRPSASENGIPRKAACILGMKREEETAPSTSPTRRPPSGGSGRTSTFTSLRGIPSFLFNGPSSAHLRQSESRSATPTGHRSNFSRPGTPSAERIGMRSMTSMGSYTTDQNKQLTELRHGVAMCCARLTVTLQREDPAIASHTSDENCKVDPAFMRSLCANVRITEEAMARCRQV
ncbi:hypothetical protein F5Y08DRAFT_186582 [Xylaria arbuscula]|nr:hypothetical protein F5Y08DRAFT_186582 [Xylaria arbuscula]